MNGDGTVDLEDVTLTLQAAVGLATLSPLQSSSADLNAGHGEVTLKDAVLALKKAIGL